MLAFSVIWLFLAGTVTLFAMLRRSHAAEQSRADIDSKVTGNAIALLAAIYSLALVAGFLYLGKILVSSF